MRLTGRSTEVVRAQMTTDHFKSDAVSNGRLDEGKATFERLTGFPAAGFIESLSDIAPRFARYAMEWEFADTFGQSVLDTRTQEIVALATFATLGATAAPILKFRIATAMRAGVTQQEIVDIFIQIGLGAGLPTALAAIKVAEDVFSESARQNV